MLLTLLILLLVLSLYIAYKIYFGFWRQELPQSCGLLTLPQIFPFQILNKIKVYGTICLLEAAAWVFGVAEM